MARTARQVKPVLDEPEATPRWIIALLVLGTLSLIFQLLPSLWWAVVAIVDVRSWTWVSYSVLFATTVVLLVAVRAWQERSR